MRSRCTWPGNDPEMIRYHDEEWGVPVLDDRKIFEFLVLECFQAGLSWSVVFKKRDAFRKAFSDFDPAKVALYSESEVSMLVENKAIIRNRAKIVSVIHNAGCFLSIQKEFGSFSNYIWGFIQHKPLTNTFRSLSELPAKTETSDLISADMKRRGFKFTGSTVIYAHMQATGMVNDHLVSCFRYSEINRMHAPH